MSENTATPRSGPRWTESVTQSVILAGRAFERIRAQPAVLVDAVLQPLLLLVVLSLLLGGVVAGSVGAYLQPLVPGLMVQTVMFLSVATAIGINTDVGRGVFDRFRSLPISRMAPIVGAVLGDSVRFLIAIGVLVATAVVMGFRFGSDPVRVVGGLVLVLAFGFALCLAWAVLGILMRSQQAAGGVVNLIVLPLVFGSNLLVPAESLPGWLRAWVDVNPVTSVISALRFLLVDQGTSDQVGTAVIVVVAIAAVATPLIHLAYRRRWT